MKKISFGILICIAFSLLAGTRANASFPDPPQLISEAAVLMDADSGMILYEKNAHAHLYPASTTKILTTLIAAENAAMTDTVTFSETAVNSVPADGSKIGMSAGEALTMEQCIYAILVGSANEVSNAVAEHLDGSIDAFVARMNETAKALGCTDSHFMNTNGLHDDNHYTSAYDLATIARAFFDNALLRTVSGTARYHLEPTPLQPDDIYITNKHKLVNGEMPYEGIVGGKTGYTSNAQETLVTCAEQNGMKLIAVVLKAPSPNQFTDTALLFDYGFDHFRRILVADEASFLSAGTSFYGNGDTLLDIPLYTLRADKSGTVILPNNVPLDALEVVTSYPEDDAGTDTPAAVLRYRLDHREVGSVNLWLDQVPPAPAPATQTRTRFVDLRNVLFVAFAAVALILMLTVGRLFLYGRPRRDTARRTLKRRLEIKRRRG